MLGSSPSIYTWTPTISCVYKPHRVDGSTEDEEEAEGKGGMHADNQAGRLAGRQAGRHADRRAGRRASLNISFAIPTSSRFLREIYFFV